MAMRRGIFPWVTACFVVLLVVASFGAGYGVGSWTRVVSPPDSSLSPSSRQQVADLRAEIADVAEDAKRIDRLVTLLLATASIFAAALGLNSYFGLKQILETAKDDSKRILDDMRERYPELASSQTNLQVIVTELNAVFLIEPDWTEHAYGRLSWRKRQEIIMAELRLTALEAFRLEVFDAYRPRLLRICQGLGRFYSSKFTAESFRPDWDRASIYFERAFRQGDPPAHLLKDFGVHLVQLEVKKLDRFDKLPPDERREIEEMRRAAESNFIESLTKNRYEAGALFGLGWLHYRNGRHQEAIEAYSKLTAMKEWHEGERRQYLSDSYRNIACCRHLSGQPADLVFSDLERSKRVAGQEERLDTWKEEVRHDSDLQSLFAAHTDRANALFN